MITRRSHIYTIFSVLPSAWDRTLSAPQQNWTIFSETTTAVFLNAEKSDNEYLFVISILSKQISLLMSSLVPENISCFPSETRIDFEWFYWGVLNGNMTIMTHWQLNNKSIFHTHCLEVFQKPFYIVRHLGKHQLFSLKALLLSQFLGKWWVR